MSRVASETYPVSEPYAGGVLDTGDGHRVAYRECGSPEGIPLLVVHGGPGSGAGSWWTTRADPDRYRIVLVDQRGCGQSSPHAGDTVDALRHNTTDDLIADFEAIRELLGVDAWVLLGASWGSTLSLSYAIAHPDRVRAMVLSAVVTTRRRDVDWLTWSMGQIYPQAFDELLSVLPTGAVGALGADHGNVPLAVAELLAREDLEVVDAAARAWCAWEDRIATLSGPPEHDPRYDDRRFRIGFARLVTHYFGHAAFLDDDAIVGRLGEIAHIPAVLVRGGLDIASPLRSAVEVAAGLPKARLQVIEDEGHAIGARGREVVIGALDRLAVQLIR